MTKPHRPQINIRLDQSDLDLMKRAARLSRVTFSAWFREVGVQVARKHIEQYEKPLAPSLPLMPSPSDSDSQQAAEAIEGVQAMLRTLKERK